MIWLTPWAWVGLIGVALPALIHLLGRGHAVAKRFPSLRFIEPSRLLPTRRTRIHDPWLLAVRAAIIATAAAALAQPLLLTARRRASLDRGVARAVIVDTSWSARRPSATGRPIADVALDSARYLVEAATAGVVVETSSPGEALQAASSWALRQRRPSEIVVLSDFQRGSIDSADVARVPRAIGLRFTRIAPRDSASAAMDVIENARTMRATVAESPGGRRYQWSAASAMPAPLGVTMLASPAEQDALDATRRAALTHPVMLPLDSARHVALIFPGYMDRARLLAASLPPRAPWMVDALAAAGAISPSVVAREGTLDGRSTLLLFTSEPPGSIGAARLAAAANDALSAAPSVDELETRTIDDAALRGWNRAAAPEAPSIQQRPADGSGPSDGRWLWVLVLVLLGIEWVMRRSRATAAAKPEVPARAA